MTKELRVLAWMHPRSKSIECNLQKGSRQPLYFQSLMDYFHYFFNRENFEQAALNIQIWVGLLHTIMIHKCCFLGLVALCSGIQHENIVQKIKRKTARETLTNYLRALFWCRLWLDWQRIARVNIYNYYIQSCTFCRPHKLFSRLHSLTQNLSIGDQQANLNYLQRNLIQDRVYGNCLLKTCHERGLLKIRLSKQLFCISSC